MSKKNILSAVISVFNGEKEIEGCLKSVSFVDEIVVVDNSSTDNTLGKVRKHTDKIFIRPNNLMLNVNKNFGFSKVSGDWILCLDADERVTPELKNEIENLKLKTENSVNGYWIPRKNIIFGKWIQHTGWYPDHQLRLFRRGKGKFEEKHVHEMVKVQGNTAYLKNDLLHYSYATIAQFLGKLNIYVINEAEQMINNGYEFKWQSIIRVPVSEFLSRFFAREGYKDGFHGLVLSLLMSFYHLLVILVVWERKGFEKIEIEDLENEIKTELGKSYKDIIFWINNEKLKRVKNPLKKMAYKIFKKFHAR